MSDTIVTTNVIEDLLHHNKVNIEYLKDWIEELEKTRVGLLKVLEDMKQSEV